MGNKSGKESKVGWTEETLEEEIKNLKPKDEHDIMVSNRSRPLKGRPRPQVELVKTNLDLPLDVILQLDKIAKEFGMTRQGVIKHYLINGLERYHEVSHLKGRNTYQG